MRRPIAYLTTSLSSKPRSSTTFFSDSRSDELQVYFAHVYLRKNNWHVKRVTEDEGERDKYLCVELDRKLERFEEL